MHKCGTIAALIYLSSFVLVFILALSGLAASHNQCDDFFTFTSASESSSSSSSSSSGSSVMGVLLTMTMLGSTCDDKFRLSSWYLVLNLIIWILASVSICMRSLHLYALVIVALLAVAGAGTAAAADIFLSFISLCGDPDNSTCQKFGIGAYRCGAAGFILLGILDFMLLITIGAAPTSLIAKYIPIEKAFYRDERPATVTDPTTVVMPSPEADAPKPQPQDATVAGAVA